MVLPSRTDSLSSFIALRASWLDRNSTILNNTPSENSDFLWKILPYSFWSPSIIFKYVRSHHVTCSSHKIFQPSPICFVSQILNNQSYGKGRWRMPYIIIFYCFTSSSLSRSWPFTPLPWWPSFISFVSVFASSGLLLILIQEVVKGLVLKFFFCHMCVKFKLFQLFKINNIVIYDFAYLRLWLIRIGCVKRWRAGYISVEV